MRLVFGLAVIIMFSSVSFAQDSPIVPLPREYKPLGSKISIDSNSAVIMLGSDASPIEKFAASQFQIHVKRRFKIDLPMVSDSAKTRPIRFVLGTAQSNPLVKELLAKYRVDVNLPAEGFLINSDGNDILVAGSDPVGVLYGQGALFDLMGKDKSGVLLQPAFVKDWPAIRWRGRPSEYIRHYLVPGSLDALAHYRINWIDLRDSNEPGHKATYAFPPGFEIDKPLVKQVLSESHNRGFFVYGSVACGVMPDQFDNVIKTFTELAELGADGLWISYDDPGAGVDHEKLISRVLALGKNRSITGYKIAITPPIGAYQNIDMPWNKSVAALDGASDVTWFFTRVPSANDVAAAKKQGITSLPAWWHNWPRPKGGILHEDAGAGPLGTHEYPYVEFMPLTSGWGSPTYDKLAHANKYTSCVMSWANRPEEYQDGAMGIWAWNPESHDWEKTQDKVYSDLFGPSQVKAARVFDSMLAKLRTMFFVPTYGLARDKNIWPCRLKDVARRPEAVELINQMDIELKTLEAASLDETIFEPARVKQLYLDPMREEITYALKMAKLDFPEYHIPAQQAFAKELLTLVQDGDEQKAAEYLNKLRPQVNAQLDEIQNQLGALKKIDAYISTWRNYVSGVPFWKEFIKSERARVEPLFAKIVNGNYPFLAAADAKTSSPRAASAPEPRILVEISPQQWASGPALWVGDWVTGLYKGPHPAAAIGFKGDIAEDLCEPGDYAQLWQNITLPEFKGRLQLQIFVGMYMKDNNPTPRKPMRFVEIYAGDKRIYREIFKPENIGAKWINFELAPGIKPGDKLKLTFKVNNTAKARRYHTVGFVGPARLLEIQ